MTPERITTSKIIKKVYLGDDFAYEKWMEMLTTADEPKVPKEKMNRRQKHKYEIIKDYWHCVIKEGMYFSLPVLCDVAGPLTGGEQDIAVAPGADVAPGKSGQHFWWQTQTQAL